MGPIVTALDELPAVPLDGVVLANELLDNLPFRIVERTGGRRGRRCGSALDGDGLTETVVPAIGELATEADVVAAGAVVPDGARLPVPTVDRRSGCTGARPRCAGDDSW